MQKRGYGAAGVEEATQSLVIIPVMLTTCDSLSTNSALQKWVHFSSFPRLQKPNWFQLIASKIEPHSNLPFKTGGWGLSSQEISYVNISRGRNILAMWKKNRPLQNRLTLHVFMVLWFRFFSTWWFYWNLEPFCISLHLVGLFWNRSLYFGEFSRALLVLSSLVNSPFAELSLQNLCNKWGGGYKGVQTSYLPYIAFPTERPCFSWLPSWSSAPLRLQNSRGLPYPSPYSTNSHPTAPPPKKRQRFSFSSFFMQPSPEPEG